MIRYTCKRRRATDGGKVWDIGIVMGFPQQNRDRDLLQEPDSDHKNEFGAPQGRDQRKE